MKKASQTSIKKDLESKFELENNFKKLSSNQINFDQQPIEDNRYPLIGRTNSPLIVQKMRLKKTDLFKLVSQNDADQNADQERKENNQLVIDSINNQQTMPVLANILNTFDLQSLLNTQLDEHTLNTIYHLNAQLLNQPKTISHLYPYFKRSNIDKNYLADNYSTRFLERKKNPEYFKPLDDNYSSFRSNEDQIIRIQIPMGELTHYPIYVSDQLNSTNAQSLIRHFIKSQLNRISSRSDLKKEHLLVAPNRLLNFIARQLDMEVDRYDKRAQETVLQNGITKVLGAFVGDVVGVVIEEILHKRGDKIAENIRTKIGDIATLLINKSNLTLEMAFKNLSKLLVKKQFQI